RDSSTFARNDESRFVTNVASLPTLHLCLRAKNLPFDIPNWSITMSNHPRKSQNLESDFIPKKTINNAAFAYSFFKNATRLEMTSSAAPIAIKARCSLVHH